MDETKKNSKTGAPKLPAREISNASLFADDIVFSNTEKILFEDDLNTPPTSCRTELMDGNPADRYSATKKLNEGGMKTIWEVDDHRTARKIAMALIQDSRIASEDDIDSFLYEARLTANLQHPNIIPIYDIALDENGNPYFTMKALKGETLGEIIKQLRNSNADYIKRYTRTRLLSIFLKVCNAIDYAHTKGVIHLDLKPSNINVGDFGDVHVLDWGLSTLLTHLNEYDGDAISWQSMDDVALETGQTLTRYLESSSKRKEHKNIVGGTPGYMSPEQAQGVPSDIDFQTDVYMLGAVLYELLTYQCPISGETVKEVLQKTVRGDFVPPGKRAPELKIPPPLSAISIKAMSTAPSDRYPNVAALIRDIHQFQDGFATTAENPTFLTHSILLIKRHKLAVSLIMITATIITFVLTQSFRSIKKSESVAVNALAELQLKNNYIEETARKVAPDYLNLMQQQEQNLLFSEAEQSLNTSLAFAPNQKIGWEWKGKILLSQCAFHDAWEILSGNQSHPVQNNPPLMRLARKYKDAPPITDKNLPQLVKDFALHGYSEGLPRLFYHLNQRPFDPQTRFKAIADALQILNPNIKNLNFSWHPFGAKGWIINVGNNPDLNDISPLCGLKILLFNAENSGIPHLDMLTEPDIVELRISGTPINRLPKYDQFKKLQLLNISNTRIKNLSDTIKFPKLASLDISRIEGIEIPSQLIWSQKLKLLTVSESHRNNPTINALAKRGVIIIYSKN